MGKYDYIKVRVNDLERQRLEEMVADGGGTSLSGALRKLAFDDRFEDRQLLARYLEEVAAAQRTLNAFARSGVSRGEAVTRLADAMAENGIEDEALEALAGQVAAMDADVMAMSREVNALAKRSANLARLFKRVM